MKRRSFVLALSMLIISIILFSSVTYAWFLTGTTANVKSVRAGITDSAGSVLISANGVNNWKTELTFEDIRTADNTENRIPAVKNGSVTLSPASVSFDYENNRIDSIRGGTMLDGVFTAMDPNSFSSIPYLYYTFYVKATKSMYVHIKPTFASDVAYVYAAMITPKAIFITNGTAKANDSAYYPYIGKIGSKANDANGDYVVDSSEAVEGALSAAAVSTVSSKNFETYLYLKADVMQKICICIWAEGQDPECNNQNANLSTMSLDIHNGDELDVQGTILPGSSTFSINLKGKPELTVVDSEEEYDEPIEDAIINPKNFILFAAATDECTGSGQTTSVQIYLSKSGTPELYECLRAGIICIRDKKPYPYATYSNLTVENADNGELTSSYAGYAFHRVMNVALGEFRLELNGTKSGQVYFARGYAVLRSKIDGKTTVYYTPILKILAGGSQLKDSQKIVEYVPEE